MKLLGDGLRLSAMDLSHGLGCEHLTQLDLRVAVGEIPKPNYFDPALAALWERGRAHEAAYLEHLQQKGLQVIAVDAAAGAGSAVEQTLRLMREGVQVVYQAHLQHDCWEGRADFLVRVDQPSALGGFSYEAVDTKLAEETRAGAILQLCLYSDLINQIQAVMPEYMTVVTPVDGFTEQRYRLAEYAAYYRAAQRDLTARIERQSATYPEPVEQCNTCRWWAECDRQRRGDDHLSLVAGISSAQRADLVEHGIKTLTALGAAPAPLTFRPRRGSRESLARVHDQARVQLDGRQAGRIVYDMIRPVEAKRGLNCLPAPSEGDVFLDIEGDAFVGREGLEYLLGWSWLERGEWRYEGAWARSAVEEKGAFEAFMAAVEARLRLYPDLHIYHYAPYEPAALKRLASRYAVGVELLDQLLRGERLIDLYRVVRQGLRASVERYSLKELEPLFGFVRQAELQEVRRHKRAIEGLLQLGAADLPIESMLVVERYNADDCRAALELRHWLEGEREKLRAVGEPIERPAMATGIAPEHIGEWLARIRGLEVALLAGVPIDPAARDERQQARWLLAHMLQWHRREANCVFWEQHRLRELEAEDLAEETSAIAALKLDGRIDAAQYNPKLRSPVYRFIFPIQEVELRSNDKLLLTGNRDRVGEILGIDYAQRWVDIKTSSGFDPTVLETATGVFKDEYVDAASIASSLERIAASAVDDGLEVAVSNPLAAKLLHRLPMRALPLQAPEPRDAVACFDGGVLAVQGPPGSGKSTEGARMILELLARGQRVGVCANSHAVIDSLMRKVYETALATGAALPRLVRADRNKSRADEIIAVHEPDRALGAFAGGDYDVLGGTAWLWSREDAAGVLDTLIIDEAGQISLANAVAVTPATRNLVLLGDPQQLAQPTQASHPDGTEVSALAHWLGDQQTISPDRGIFLHETYRLHPEISRYISELYYDGRLHSAARRELQQIDGVPGYEGAGLRLELVRHQGNSSRCDDEVERVASLAQTLLATGAFTNSKGERRALSVEDVLIVAPYNAQVNALRDALPGYRVGTVDKFQGQEAAIVIYSMTSSSAEDAPRGMDFLYDSHRLNVAISRAQALAILVASPDLFQARVRSPKQMKLANALARFAELANQQS